MDDLSKKVLGKMGKNALKRKWLDFDACALRLIP